MASITRLHVYRERMCKQPEPVMTAEPVTTEPPLLTESEFSILLEAMRYYTRDVLQKKPEDETPRQRRIRGMKNYDLQTAISKIRKQFNPL